MIGCIYERLGCIDVRLGCIYERLGCINVRLGCIYERLGGIDRIVHWNAGRHGQRAQQKQARNESHIK